MCTYFLLYKVILLIYLFKRHRETCYGSDHSAFESMVSFWRSLDEPRAMVLALAIFLEKMRANSLKLEGNKITTKQC
jgi:hypothetical protein